MGYDTYFRGSFKFNKPVDDWLVDYINKFNKTRRMKRSNEQIKANFHNWKELCFNGELGNEGEYFIGGIGHYGQYCDTSVLNGNCPPARQPGLWCQWIIGGDNDELVWDEGEKFYDYYDWLFYMIKHFFEPLGYVLNGEIEFEGEESEDFGVICVTENVISMQYGIRVNSINEIETNKLIAELESRGYAVSK